MGKSRCIPLLLQRGANIDLLDKHNKTPLDLAATDKIKKLILAYGDSKGFVFDPELKEKKNEFNKISESKLK